MNLINIYTLNASQFKQLVTIEHRVYILPSFTPPKSAIFAQSYIFYFISYFKILRPKNQSSSSYLKAKFLCYTFYSVFLSYVPQNCYKPKIFGACSFLYFSFIISTNYSLSSFFYSHKIVYSSLSLSS